MCEALQGCEIRWSFLRTFSLGRCVTGNSHKDNMSHCSHYANLIAFVTLKGNVMLVDKLIQDK